MRRERLRAAAAAGLLASLASAPALAAQGFGLSRPDAVFTQAGAGEHVDSVTLGGSWDWDWHRATRLGLVAGYTELSFGGWRATRGADDRFSRQLGITPVLRLYPGGTAAGWFVEGGIGANVIGPRYENGTRRFSTAFNFGDHIGVGQRFGHRGEHELSLRVQHFSNGGYRRPNPGENFVQVRYLKRF
jgi:lipid A 3-O-deacylase